LASLLAKDFAGIYSDKSQILATSHSPAFLSLGTKENENKVSIFRVFKGNYVDPQTDELIPSSRIINTKEHRNSDADIKILNEEIGILEMHRRHHNSLMKDIELLRSGYDSLKKIFASATGPILLVEGKTDVKIINTAWRKLFPNKKIPFSVESCNLFSDSSTASSAGVDILLLNIQSHRESEKSQVALVDYDPAGINCFNKACINRNFEKKDDSMVVCKNKKVALILIPEIKGLDKYRKFNNLPIEFLFPEECLKAKTPDGHGLSFKKGKSETTIRGVKVNEKEIDDLEARIIDGGKVIFAEQLVKKFRKECFKNFIPLFDKISEAFQNLKK